MRRLAAFVLLSLLGAGCGLGKKELVYDNPVALRSTIERPATGSEEDRTYRNSAYGDRIFPSVTLQEPRIRGIEPRTAELQQFRSDLQEALVTGTLKALLESGRFARVADPEATDSSAAFLCRVDALAHVAALGEPIRPDPTFRDPRPKVLVIFTLEDLGSGEVVFRFTGWETSKWEYGPWAMEDLTTLAYGIALDFGEALKVE